MATSSSASPLALYSKIKWSFPQSKINLVHVASIFPDHWIAQSGILSYLPVTACNSSQIFRKKWSGVQLLGLRHLKSTESLYHRKNEKTKQADSCNTGIISLMCHVVENHNHDWDIYLLLTYAYDTQIHRTACTAPFNRPLTCPPHGATMFNSMKGLESGAFTTSSQQYWGTVSCVESQLCTNLSSNASRQLNINRRSIEAVYLV